MTVWVRLRSLPTEAAQGPGREQQAAGTTRRGAGAPTSPPAWKMPESMLPPKSPPLAHTAERPGARPEDRRADADPVEVGHDAVGQPWKSSLPLVTKLATASSALRKTPPSAVLSP